MASLSTHRVEKVTAERIETLRMDDGRVTYSRGIVIGGEDEEVRINVFSNVKKNLAVIEEENHE